MTTTSRRRRLTLAGFLRQLARTRRDWRLDANQHLMRTARTGFYHCPISAVTHRPDDFAVPTQAGMRLGLTRATAYAVYLAADAKAGHDPTLRARLLKACGLAK